MTGSLLVRTSPSWLARNTAIARGAQAGRRGGEGTARGSPHPPFSSSPVAGPLAGPDHRGTTGVLIRARQGVVAFARISLSSRSPPARPRPRFEGGPDPHLRA